MYELDASKKDQRMMKIEKAHEQKNYRHILKVKQILEKPGTDRTQAEIQEIAAILNNI